MTTLLVDLDKGLVATDNQCTGENLGDNYNRKEYSKVNKLFVGSNRVLVGCGSLGSVTLAGGCILDDEALPFRFSQGNTTILVVTKTDEGRFIADEYEAVEKKRNMLEVLIGENKGYYFRHKKTITEGVWYAGSGGGYAIGAYKACNDIKKSIQCASKCDVYSGFGVKIFDLNKWEIIE